MKVFIDTNVWVAAYISQGLCKEVLAFCERRHEIVISEQILKEFEKALTKKIKISIPNAKASVKDVRLACTLQASPRKPTALCRDPHDDNVLQAALDADCDFLVSGDQDLLVLKKVQGMPILSPRQFLEIFGVSGEED